MTARLNAMSYPDIVRAIDKAAGRNVRTSDRVEITDFGDCCRTDYWWDDGACRSILHDTRTEAHEDARCSGFNC
jgi:hypothetical protein